MVDIDFDFINRKMNDGYSLRIDVGLSFFMPNSIEWLKSNNKIFVIGIEPHPNNFTSCQKLIKNSSYEDNCYLIESAIDDVKKPGKKVFYGLNADGDPGTSSLKKPKGRFKDCIENIYHVDVISLKYLLDNINYTLIDYIKTDTQGNDLNVLKSLGDHIFNVVEIQSEYDCGDTYECCNTGKELDDFLEQSEFEKYDPVYFYYTDNNGNNMYQIIDYKYRNRLLHQNSV